MPAMRTRSTVTLWQRAQSADRTANLKSARLVPAATAGSIGQDHLAPPPLEGQSRSSRCRCSEISVKKFAGICSTDLRNLIETSAWVSVITGLRPFLLAASRIAMVALLTAITVFWAARVYGGNLRQEFEEARDSNPVAPLINGRKVSIDYGTAVVSRSSSAASATTLQGRTLVIVTADSCRFCQAVAPKWRSMLRRSPLRGDDKVCVISFEGHQISSQLEEELRARNLRYEIRAVVDKQSFIRSAGVPSTPTMLILDRDARIRFATSLVDASTIAILDDVLSEP